MTTSSHSALTPQATGDREIRQSTKSDLGHYSTSFNVTGIKMIPVSRGIRIYRSPEMNVEFSKLCLKDVFYIVCTYCTTKELINSFAPYIYFVNPITTRTASRNAKNERFSMGAPSNIQPPNQASLRRRRTFLLSPRSSSWLDLTLLKHHPRLP